MKFSNRTFTKTTPNEEVIKQILKSDRVAWYGNEDGTVWRSDTELVLALVDVYEASEDNEYGGDDVGVFALSTLKYYDSDTRGYFEEITQDSNFVGIYPPDANEQKIRDHWIKISSFKKRMEAEAEA